MVRVQRCSGGGHKFNHLELHYLAKDQGSTVADIVEGREDCIVTAGGR